jgi:hypothetical protein
MKLLGMMVMLGFAGRCAFAQSCIEIRTELDWTSVWEGSAKSRSTVVSAVCVIGNNEWWIDHDFLRNGRVIWHYDGTNAYQTTRVLGAFARGTAAKNRATDESSDRASRPNEVQYHDTGMAF